MSEGELSTIFSRRILFQWVHWNYKCRMIRQLTINNLDKMWRWPWSISVTILTFTWKKWQKTFSIACFTTEILTRTFGGKGVLITWLWCSVQSCYCHVGVLKKPWWQFASRCCWNRARPWHVSELVSFLVGLRTYQHPGTNEVIPLILLLLLPGIKTKYNSGI